MEIGSFRGFRFALGFGSPSTEEPLSTSRVREESARHNKPRTDSAGSNSSGRSSHSSSSRSRSRSHRSFTEELNLPVDQAFVQHQQEETEDVVAENSSAPADEEELVREEVICMIFDLPRSTTFYKVDDVVADGVLSPMGYYTPMRLDFSCAIAAAFPMHGRMYPTSSHVCFYSNVFGHERKILIPYETIREMALATTLMFQGAIKITTGTGDEYTFTSFWGTNRESCFALITQIRDRVVGVDTRRSRSSLAEEETDEEEEGEQVEDGSGGGGKGATALPRTVSDGGLVTAPRDISMTLLLEATFDVSVDTFLATFVWDGASFGWVQYNARIGTTEMQCNPWSSAAPGDGRTRSLQFRVPIDSPIGPKSSRVDVLQCAKARGHGVYVVESSTRLVDIPYGDYFRVEDRWTLVPRGQKKSNACTLTIELKVVFAQSTFWRSQIESRALVDNKAKWTAWVQMAKQHLVSSDAAQAPGPSASPTAVEEATPTREGGIVGVEHRPQQSSRSSASSSSRRRRQRRAIAVVIPWVLILVLLWMISKLSETVGRMEQLLVLTHERVAQLQVEVAQLRMERDVCR